MGVISSSVVDDEMTMLGFGHRASHTHKASQEMKVWQQHFD